MQIEYENPSVGEAVRMFGIGRTKLYELIQRGDIEAVKLGRRTLIRAASARAFMESLPRLGGASGGK
jgi:excisionase family DNA binding protein